MIKNIIFDIGEVLVDFTYREHFANLGYKEDMIERLIRATIFNPSWSEYDLGLLPDEEVVQLFINSDPEIEKDIHRSMENCHDLVKMRDFAIPWVKELKNRGFQVFFLSNYYEKLIRENPEALSFREYMDGGVFSCHIHAVKPEPAIYEHLLNKYHLKAEESVFFDDREANVNAANALGIHGIIFSSYEQARDDLDCLILSLT